MISGTTIAVLLIILLVVVITVPIVILQQKRQAGVWTEVASRLGLSLRPRSNALSPVVVEGKYQDHSVVLDTYTTQHKDHPQTYTRIVMSVDNPGGLMMELTTESALDKVARKLGADDVETGDAEVDRQLKIHGQPEEAIRRVVTAAPVRQRLLDESRLYIRLSGGELVWRTSGVQRQPDRLREALDLLSALATEVERTQV